MSFFSRLFSYADSTSRHFSTAAKSAATNYVISGYPECRFFQKAQNVGKLYQEKYPNEVAIEVISLPYDEFHQHRINTLAELGMAPESHRTCPLVYEYESDGSGKMIPTKFIGGCDSFCELMVAKHGAEEIATRKS